MSSFAAAARRQSRSLATMAMTREETFGPVAGIQRFASEEEAIALANDTPYGLAAYFYSGGLGRVWRVSEGLE